MKHAAAILLATVSVVLVPASAGAASCHVPGGRTVATSSIAKLVSVPTPDGRGLYACIRRNGHKVILDSGYSDARLAGRWVTWQRPGRPGHWRIAVHDLKTGRERLVDGHVAAHSLGITTRGSIVWAQLLDASSATPLFANEVGRGGQLLDNGDVDAGSVILQGRRVSWLSGGDQRSALIR